MHCSLCSRVLLLALATPFAGQIATAQASPVPPGARAISRTAGLDFVDGQLWGGGDRYKVRFDQRRVEFTPALGRAAPHDYPLTLELVSIGRGGAVSPLVAAVPTAGDLRVEYDRGVAIERYDVGVDAMEQSFVFRDRPAGSGDLVVRSRLATDLEVSEDGDGLGFVLPGVGGVRMGGVIGIDARGNRVRGGAHYQDGFLELSLPADFVDHAALPFVLDPPFAGASQLNGPGGTDDEAPYVAYDLTRDVYLVIWTPVFSATDHDVHGQRVSRGPTPVPIGGRLFIETSTALETEPQVADCDGRDAFVVVYTRNGDIIGRTVDAATGAVSGSAIVAGGVAVQHFGCVATVLNSNQVLCAWQTDDIRNTLNSCAVVVDANLTLTPGTTHTIIQAFGVSRPRLSKSDRGTGRHAVVYQAPTLSNTQANLRIVDNNGVPISSSQALFSRMANQTEPEVDGDGTTWTAAWREPFNAAIHVVVLASYSLDPATQQLVQNGTGGESGFVLDLTAPSVTCIKDSCLLGYGLGTHAHIDSLDPFRCSFCEGDFPIGVASLIEGTPFGCSVQASGGTTEDTLVAWEQSDPATLNGDIIVRAWNTVDGGVTSLGGGCGRGGSNRATCARSPSSSFSHRLRGALPSAPAVFLLSAARSSFPCGPCNVVPDLTTALTLGLGTDALGNVSLPSQIPSMSPLIGVPLFTQWATVDLAAPACTVFPLHLSNALRLVIES